MGTSRFWIGRQDLSVAMRELSQILSLDLNGEYIDGLDEALNETWHGSTYDQGKIVPGPWMTLVHHGDPNLQVAKDASSYASKRSEIFEGDTNLQVANADESSYAQ